MLKPARTELFPAKSVFWKNSLTASTSSEFHLAAHILSCFRRRAASARLDFDNKEWGVLRGPSPQSKRRGRLCRVRICECGFAGFILTRAALLRFLLYVVSTSNVLATKRLAFFQFIPFFSSPPFSVHSLFQFTMPHSRGARPTALHHSGDGSFG